MELPSGGVSVRVAVGGGSRCGSELGWCGLRGLGRSRCQLVRWRPQASAAASIPLRDLWLKMAAGDQYTAYFTELAAEAPGWCACRAPRSWWGGWGRGLMVSVHVQCIGLSETSHGFEVLRMFRISP